MKHVFRAVILTMAAAVAWLVISPIPQPSWHPTLMNTIGMDAETRKLAFAADNLVAVEHARYLNEVFRMEREELRDRWLLVLATILVGLYWLDLIGRASARRPAPPAASPLPQP